MPPLDDKRVEDPARVPQGAAAAYCITPSPSSLALSAERWRKAPGRCHTLGIPADIKAGCAGPCLALCVRGVGTGVSLAPSRLGCTGRPGIPGGVEHFGTGLPSSRLPARCYFWPETLVIV